MSDESKKQRGVVAEEDFTGEPPRPRSLCKDKPVKKRAVRCEVTVARESP